MSASTGVIEEPNAILVRSRVPRKRRCVRAVGAEVPRAARGPTTTAARAAALVSRACSPGVSVVDGLAAAVAPVAHIEPDPARKVQPLVAAGAWARVASPSARRRHSLNVWLCRDGRRFGIADVGRQFYA